MFIVSEKKRSLRPALEPTFCTEFGIHAITKLWYNNDNLTLDECFYECSQKHVVGLASLETSWSSNHEII